MAPPPTFGPFRALRELGRGGMGVVYEVERVETGGRYALKTLALDLATLDPDWRARFAREAQLAARLDHPHVVRTHAADLEARPPWVVQDLVPGGSLEARLRARGPLPIEEAVDLARKVALGLAHAHARGVLHRDVKPDNVLLDEDGEPRLVDFGLARPVGDGTRLSVTGTVLGTPAYMAPEQALGDAVDARADVYAVGALLFALLTGGPPYRERQGGTLALLEAVISGRAEPLRALRPDVPPAVEAVVRRAMARRPDDRFASAEDLALALESSLAPPAPRRGRGGLLALVVAALAAVGLAGAALARAGSARADPGHAEPAPAPPPSPVPDELEPPARRARPDWRATLGGPATFRLRWNDRPPGEDNLLDLTFEQAAPQVVGDEALLRATIARLRFRLTGLHKIEFDSSGAEGPPRIEGSDIFEGTEDLLRAVLAATVQVRLNLRTGAVTTVQGLPEVRRGPDSLVFVDAEGEVRPIAQQALLLSPYLENEPLRTYLSNALHVFPARDGDATFSGRVWCLPTTWLEGDHRLEWSDDGDRLVRTFQGRGRLSFSPTAGQRDGRTVFKPDVRGAVQLAGERIVRTELSLYYEDPAIARDWSRSATTTFELLEGQGR
ncbi:MAG: serine/threonine protein kinase [Planctomycetes bacterium]|nr:serine/threonine protein kinase [Planctomycetota bacterium]